MAHRPALLVSLVVATQWGCATADVAPKTPLDAQPPACRRDILDPRELAGAPDWVTSCTSFEGLTPDSLCAVGKATERSPTLAQAVATAMARRELAAGVSARLEAELSMKEQADAGAQTREGRTSSQRVNEAVDAMVLSGSSRRAEWISTCGTLHALVVLPSAAMEQAKAEPRAR